MTNPVNPRVARLDQLLDIALGLDGEARTHFLDSEEVPIELRDDLAQLLKASGLVSPLDRTPLDLVPAAAALLQRDATYSAISAGQRIGHYRLLRLIGEGGMASVWLADRDDGAFSHQVAVKCLKTGLATPESRARFLREQQILAQLQHPNIARLYDAGISDDGVPYIVMEWVDGSPLARYCDERRLSVRKRMQLFQKITSVVAYAHQNLIVHRDLKPGNILVTNAGEPKLLDFGIAKLLNDEAQPATRTGLYLLTPEYAAPEQFIGGPITTATDVYALGAVMYELLSGLRPRSQSAGQALNMTARVPPPSEALKRAPKTKNADQLAQARHSAPDRLRRTLQGDLDTIALKALQSEPNRRYASAQALGDDIERYLQQQPIQARKDAWMYRAGKFLQRHALAAAVSTMVVALLLTATGISLYQARRAEIQTALAQAQMQRAQTEANRAGAVESFLTNLFEVADSGVPRDKVPSTETLLEDGAKRVQVEFKDAPEVKLRLLLLLGRVQTKLGLYDSAETLLKEAVSVADKNLSPATETWLSVHVAWAILLQRRSQLEPAEQYLMTSITSHRDAGAGDSKTLADALNQLGNVYRQRDRFEQAIATAQGALAISKRLFGAHHASVQQAMARLGVALQDARRLGEAEATLRANLALSRELYGDHKAQFALSLNSLASVLGELDKSDESEQLARQAVAINESVYDRPNVDFIASLGILGRQLFNQRKFLEAKSVYERMLKMQMELDGSDNAIMSDILYSLGDVAFWQADYPQAERLKRQSLELTRKHYGPRNSRVAATLGTLGQVLTFERRHSEAIAVLEEAAAIQRESYGENSQPLGYTLGQLAFAEIKAGYAQRALDHIEASLQIFKTFLPADDPYMHLATIEKAQALNDLSRYAQAKELLVPVIASVRATDASPSLTLSEGLSALGHAQAGLGQTEEARLSWNEALALLRANPSSNPQDIKELETSIRKSHTISIGSNPSTRPTGR